MLTVVIESKIAFGTVVNTVTIQYIPVFHLHLLLLGLRLYLYYGFDDLPTVSVFLPV